MKQKGFTLIEVIISIVILSAVSAVILNLFVKSANINLKVETESLASLYCINAIESHKNDSVTAPTTLQFFYRENWQEVADEAQAEYRIELQMKPQPQNKYLIAVTASAFNASDKCLATCQTDIIKRDKAVLSW